MNLVWGILIAMGAGWYGINILMPKPNLKSAAQRLTIIAVVFAYGVFVLTAFWSNLNRPFGFSLTRFLIEGVLLGAIAGLVTYGLAQLIHWAVKGQTMKGIVRPEKSNLQTDALSPKSSPSKELVPTASLNALMATFGITGNFLMLFTFTGVNGWSYLFGLLMIALVAAGALAKKHRSPWWLLFSMVPFGWIVYIVLKKRT